jgi:hypothetical protein
MGRKPNSAYTPEELEEKRKTREYNVIDGLFENYYADDTDETTRFITEIKNTTSFFYFLAKMAKELHHLKLANQELKDKVSALEEINENMSGAFKKRNDYDGY